MTQVVVRVIDLHIVRWEKDVPMYLLMHRSKGQMYEGLWQGVTGKMEVGEQAWQTAIRELDEETGLKPKKLWTVDRVNFFYEAEFDRMNAIPIFGVEVTGTEVKLSKEHDFWQWCDITDAARLLIWDQQREGLLSFHDMLTKSKDKQKWLKVDFKK